MNQQLTTSDQHHIKKNLIEWCIECAKRILAKIIKDLKGREGTDVIFDRPVKWKYKARVHSLKEPWVYDGWATDLKTGIKSQAKHYKSAKGAVKHAYEELGKKLVAKGILDP